MVPRLLVNHSPFSSGNYSQTAKIEFFQCGVRNVFDENRLKMLFMCENKHSRLRNDQNFQLIPSVFEFFHNFQKDRR